jgi:hypothetical protein
MNLRLRAFSRIISWCCLFFAEAGTEVEKAVEVLKRYLRHSGEHGMSTIGCGANGSIVVTTPFVADIGKAVRVPIGVVDNSDI